MKIDVKKNGVIFVESGNSFGLVTEKEILGPFHIQKNKNNRLTVSSREDELSAEQLKSLQTEHFSTKGDVQHG